MKHPSQEQVEQWLAELTAIPGPKESGGETMEEIGYRLGRSGRQVSRLLKSLLPLGMVTLHRETRLRIDGRAYTTTTFKIKEPPRGKVKPAAAKAR